MITKSTQVDLHPVWWGCSNSSLSHTIQSVLVLANSHLLQNPLNKVTCMLFVRSYLSKLLNFLKQQCTQLHCCWLNPNHLNFPNAAVVPPNQHLLSCVWWVSQVQESTRCTPASWLKVTVWGASTRASMLSTRVRSKLELVFFRKQICKPCIYYMYSVMYNYIMYIQ